MRVDGGASLYAQPWPIPSHSKMPAYGDLPEGCTSTEEEDTDTPRSRL